MIETEVIRKKKQEKTISITPQKKLTKNVQLNKANGRARAKSEKLLSALKLKKMGALSEEIADSLGLSVELIDSLA